MSLTRTSSFLLIFSLLFTLSCSRYSVSINENVVYEPPKLFSAYEISSNALKECVRSTIAENKLTKAEQLTHLICPPGDIEQLDGLQTFKQIEYLGLAGNKIVNIVSITSLTSLSHLDVSNNDIVDFSLLKGLDNLSLLKAKGNANANCQTLKQLNNSIELVLPRHCKG